jgi:thiamine kinase-like enzyme
MVGFNGRSIYWSKIKMTCLNNINAPEWWSYTTEAWQQVVDFFSARNKSEKQTELMWDDLIARLKDQSNWEDVEGGITNYNFRLSLSQENFFIQVLDSEKLKRLPTQRFVPNNLVIEKCSLLKSWLVPCLHETELLRVFEWVEAENTSSNVFRSGKLERDLIQFLTSLHSSIGILPILDIKQHLEHYYKLAVKSNPSKKKEYKEQLKRGLECANSFVPTKNCHNDLSPGNLLYSKKDGRYQLHVVDWEYACISDPFFDLAGVCINFDFSEEQESRLIESYSEKLSIYPSLDKFNKMKELYQIVNLLWSA